MTFRFAPDEADLTKADLDRYGRVPFLLSNDMEYLDEANRFLRERATGAWRPHRGDVSAYAARSLLSDNTLDAYSRDLENFWTYVEAQRLSWRAMTYQDLLDSYDKDMGRGRWSEDGKPLSPSTINRRVDLAAQFLEWAADRGERSPFKVPVDVRSKPSGNGRREPIEVRVGRRRVDPGHLRLPTAEEINRWLAEVRARRGATKALACRTILETGMRLEETVLLRVGQLPDPAAVEPGKPARMEIRYGTKGSREPGDAAKAGKPRTLRFAASFLRELSDYAALRRAKAAVLFKAGHPGRPVPPQLFLSERTGEPITAAVLYKAWHACESLPYPGFSPHVGRHSFACVTLLRLLQEETALMARTTDAVPRSTLLEHARNLVGNYIRPVLGHVSEATTERYLGWVADHVWVAEHRSAWSAYLDAADA